MKPHEVRQILLMALSVPDYARVEYFIKARKESGLSDTVFLKYIIDAYKYYWNSIEIKEAEINSFGNDAGGFKLPLLTETGGLMTGHLGHQELASEIFPAIENLTKALNYDTALDYSNSKVYELAANYLDLPETDGFSMYERGNQFYTITIDGHPVPVLNSNIYKLFNPNLPLSDGTTIDGMRLLAIYIEGFKKGKDHFKEYYNLDSPVTSNLVENLRRAFYVEDPVTKDDAGLPWENWLFRHSSKFDLLDVFNFGFYAALYLSVLELKAHFPVEFKEFDSLPDTEENYQPMEVNGVTDKLRLLELLGILEYLRTTYPEFRTSPKKLSTLLASLLNVKINTENGDWKTLKSNVGTLNASTRENVMRPLPIEKIMAELNKIGILIK